MGARIGSLGSICWGTPPAMPMLAWYTAALACIWLAWSIMPGAPATASFMSFMPLNRPIDVPPSR